MESSRGVHVLYISYDGLTDPLGQSQILPYVKGLAKLGYRFTILSFEKPVAFKKNRQAIEAECRELSITWFPQRYHKSPPVLSTMYDLYQLWRHVSSINRKDNVDILHCRSYITALVGLRAKRQWGTKFIFDMRGFWADERVEGGLWNLKNPLFALVYRFFKKKERQFLTEADHVISLTHNAKAEILSWNIPVASISVIPTCVDLDFFNPELIQESDKKELRKRLGIAESDFVLLYLGSWGTWYLTKEMLDFFTKLREGNSMAKFLIVTENEVDVSGYQFASDIIVTSAARSSVPLHISIADLSVCFVKPTFSKKASSATKLGEMLAMNIPVVVNSGWGDVDQLPLPNELVIKEQIEPAYASAIQFITSKMFSPCGTPRELSLDWGTKRYSDLYEMLNRHSAL